MRQNGLSLILFATVIALSNTIIVSTAQDADSLHQKKTYAWAGAGLGITSLGGGLAGIAHITVQHNNTVFSVRTSAQNASEADGFFGGVGDEFFDLGILVGIGRRDRSSRRSIAIGLARVTGTSFEPTGGVCGFFSSYGTREDLGSWIGIPIEAQISGSIGGVVGVGAYIYANINQERIFGGVTLNLQLGAL